MKSLDWLLPSWRGRGADYASSAWFTGSFTNWNDWRGGAKSGVGPRRSKHNDTRGAQSAHPWLEQIELYFDERPDVLVQRRSGMMCVIPKNIDGLAAFVIVEDGRATLAIGSWYDDFCHLGELLMCIDGVMTGTMRLRTDWAGAQPIGWALERRHNGRWVEYNAMEPLTWRLPAVDLTQSYQCNRQP